jgi:tetratricopeptide (TPR) repeat protein
MTEKDYVREAEYQLNSTFLKYIKFVDKESRYSEAASFYKKAANLAYYNKNYSTCIKYFEKAYHLLTEINEYLDIKDILQGLLKCYNQMHDTENKIKTIEKIISVSQLCGNLSDLSKWYVLLGEIVYKESDDNLAAINYYELAIDHTDSNFSQIKYKRTVATMHMEMQSFSKALKCYKWIIENYSDEPIIKFQLGDIFIEYVSCILATGDTVFANRVISDIYGIMDKDIDFINKLIKSVEDNNIEDFTRNVSDYDSIKNFNPIMVKVLLFIKKNFTMEKEDELV